MEEQAKKAAEILKLIANSNRLLILCALEEGKKTVSELNQVVLDISMPALSQHLSALRLARLIQSEKHGLYVYYTISDWRIMKIIQLLKETYCSENE